jgi:hypothetical protein
VLPIIPGVYPDLDASSMAPVAPGFAGAALVIGVSDGGDPSKVYSFRNILEARSVIREGRILRHISRILKPSPELNGAAFVKFVRAQIASQGSIILGGITGDILLETFSGDVDPDSMDGSGEFSTYVYAVRVGPGAGFLGPCAFRIFNPWVTANEGLPYGDDFTISIGMDATPEVTANADDEFVEIGVPGSSVDQTIYVYLRGTVTEWTTRWVNPEMVRDIPVSIRSIDGSTSADGVISIRRHHNEGSGN